MKKLSLQKILKENPQWPSDNMKPLHPALQKYRDRVSDYLMGSGTNTSVIQSIGELKRLVDPSSQVVQLLDVLKSLFVDLMKGMDRDEYASKEEILFSKISPSLI